MLIWNMNCSPSKRHLFWRMHYTRGLTKSKLNCIYGTKSVIIRSTLTTMTGRYFKTKIKFNEINKNIYRFTWRLGQVWGAQEGQACARAQARCFCIPIICEFFWLQQFGFECTHHFWLSPPLNYNIPTLWLPKSTTMVTFWITKKIASGVYVFH